jgi:hypothetical protein
VSATAYERLLDRLRDQGKNVRANGTKATAQCPAHEDRNPSLRVTAITGSVLLHCHAGCHTDDVLASLNLTKGDLYDEPSGARYDYLDIQGLVRRTVHRSPEKQFRQSGDTQSQPILYRLPEVVQAIRDHKTVYLVEGEKDADAIVSLGGVATTAPMGANNFNKVDIGPLGNAHLIAIRDQDEGGEGWAQQVHNRLDGFAADITWKRPAVGKDAADHIAAGYGLKDFVVVAADAPEPDAPEPEGRNSWAAVDITPVLDGLWKPPQPTVGRRSDGKGLFYPGKCHTAIGETESGKTWLALGAAYEEMKRGNHVLYLDFEDDEGTVVSRLLTIAVSQDDISRRDLIAQRFHYVRPETPLDDDNIAALRNLVQESRPTLAILDGITEAMTMHGLNPLDNVDAAKFGRILPRRLAATGAAVVSLDHVTKDRTGRSRYAIGAVHKLNALDGAGYILENIAPFGVGEKGRSVVRIAKDRPGQLRRHAIPERNELHNYGDLVLDSQDEGFAELRIYPPLSHDDDAALKALMDKTVLLLATKPDGLAQRRILAGIKGGATAKKIEALDQLILEGVVTEKSPHKLINQEEEEPSQTDQTDPVPTCSPAFPERAKVPVPRSPSLRGTGTGTPENTTEAKEAGNALEGLTDQVETDQVELGDS